MEREKTILLMVINTPENTFKVRGKELANTVLLVDQFTLANIITTSLKAMVNTLGQMEEDMRENTSLTRKKASELFTIKTRVNSKVTGQMAKRKKTKFM